MSSSMKMVMAIIRHERLQEVQDVLDECGAHHCTGGVEQNRSVHLSGEPDTANFFSPNRRFQYSPFYRDAAGAPPIARILFRPARMRRRERLMFFSARRDDGAGDVHQQRARAARANVNAEEVDVALRSSRWN